jgi:hypothetical protein
MDYLERLRKPRAVGLLALAALLALFAACQLVAGVQSRSLDPILGGCSLPTSGSSAYVRFANLAPNGDALDVCIRATGSSWGEPLILNGGTGCASSFPSTGFTYSQITVPFPAPSETVDVKTVIGGGTCNSASVGELNGVKLLSPPSCTASQCVTTLIALGGAAGQPRKLVALPEWDSQPSTGGELFRFVDALPGVSSLDFGSGLPPAAGIAQLPIDIAPPAWNLDNPVPYGATLSKGDKSAFGGTVGDGGYLAVIEGKYNLLATAHGQADALLLFPNFETGSVIASVYAVGLAFNDSYPIEGLSCIESQSEASTSNPLLMNCTTSALPTLSFDVFNPALYGNNSPDFNVREALYGSSPATNPIGSRTSDVMCLVEVDLVTPDQQNLIAAGKAGNYNYSYTISANLSTPFSNGGATQDGGTCPTTTQQAACASVAPATLQNAFTCMEQFCSSGGAMGILDVTTDCLSTNCMGPLADLLISAPSCVDCVLANVTSNQTYAASQNTCTKNPSPPLGYQGNENSLILSKYPIVNSDSYVLPSSYYRRSVLYTQVQFPGNVTIDFFCGFLQTLGIYQDLPYQGCFGNGATTSLGGYSNENLFEAQLMASWIQAKVKKSGNPAVILGDWHTGVGGGMSPDAGFPPPTAIGAATIQYLMGPGGLTAVNGPNWPAAGQCNNCPGSVNLLNAPNTTSYFTMQPFIYNWPPSTGNNNPNPLYSEQLIFTQNVIAINGGTTNNAPISPYYGVNIEVLPPPGKAQSDAGATQ